MAGTEAAVSRGEQSPQHMSKTTNDPYLKHTGSDIITLQTSFKTHVSTNGKALPIKGDGAA